MVENVFAIYPHDTVHQPFILRRMKDGKLSVMDEYRPLICKKCRKVDERAALAQGISEEVVVRSKRPFLESLDDHYLLDQRARQLFTALFPDEIVCYAIPHSAFCVATPKVWLLPNESNPGVRFAGPRCPECNRPGQIVWGKGPLAVGERRRFRAVNLESVQGARAIWLVTSDAAAELKGISPPLTGMVLSPQHVEIETLA
jgi:hypothetical protein